MFRRVLVANRGEVAARVIRTLRRLGIGAVAVASEADRELSYLAEADEVVVLHSPLGPRAYLDQDALLDAARVTGCTALHPGWGFLAENAVFAARCESRGLTFVGPRSSTIRRMGDKALARETMRARGMGPIPGSDGPVPDAATARRVADRLGYPVLLKAVSGGGGRGMRRVEGGEGIEAAFDEASAEAASAFGDGTMYLEKLVEHARHVEVQVMGAWDGVQHLFERDCSVQRRNQKLIEEAPCPVLDRDTARAVCERAARALSPDARGHGGYLGAGTVESLLAPDGETYFMEANTRLQVEHTVTEMLTGLDLVELQLKAAANHPLAELFGEPPRAEGHAIECRINAEDAWADFRPVPGRIERLVLPEGEGVRVDTHLAQGDRIPPHYDSMIAKVVAHGRDRDEAIARMDRALSEMVVDGVPTTIPLHRRILAHADFRAARIHTRWLESVLDDLLASAPEADR
jgi:Biotin carboxylase